MKIVFTSIFLLSIAVISFSCEESFNPKTDFEQQYALFCIVNGDTTYQFAFIEKSYNVQGFDPSIYTGNPFVPDAQVKILYQDKEYTLMDSSSSINNQPFKFYYTDSLQPDPNKSMEINAVLPGGKILTGATITPKSSSLSFQSQNTNSDSYIEEKPGGLFFIWKVSGEDTSGILFLPKLKMNYFKKVNGVNVAFQKEIPISYFQNGDNYLPNFPIVTGETQVTYEMDAVNRAMNEISAGDSVKTNYTIIDANFELLLLDNNLAPYYLTIQTFLDSYTVILDQQDYSNINGGFGVFGSFFRRVHHLSFSESYVTGFGYRLASP
jgi:hypothetical protein